jgi:hypothetical protein
MRLCTVSTALSLIRKALARQHECQIPTDCNNYE